MKFEHISILKGKLSEEEKNKEIQNFKNYFTNNEIEIAECEDIGLKKLAYDIKNNKEGFYIRFILNTKYVDISSFEEWLRKNDNVLKFITIKMEETIKKELNIYNEIRHLGESNLFNAIAEKVIEQLDNIEDIETNLENVRDIVYKVLDDEYFNENLDNCIDFAIDNKIKQQENVEEQDEI